MHTHHSQPDAGRMHEQPKVRKQTVREIATMTGHQHETCTLCTHANTPTHKAIVVIIKTIALHRGKVDIPVYSIYAVPNKTLELLMIL